MLILNFPFIFMIRGYKKCISPLLGNHCRFYPTCSDYALQALKQFNIFKALLKIIWRLLRCAPWSKGGYDPVIHQHHIGE